MHIEIASGLIDLVCDLTDETFDKMQEDPKKKNQLKPADWREFIGLFKDGKKCSTRNVTAKNLKDENDKINKVLTESYDVKASTLLQNDYKEDTVKGLYEFLCQAG